MREGLKDDEVTSSEEINQGKSNTKEGKVGLKLQIEIIFFSNLDLFELRR